MKSWRVGLVAIGVGFVCIALGAFILLDRLASWAMAS